MTRHDILTGLALAIGLGLCACVFCAEPQGEWRWMEVRAYDADCEICCGPNHTGHTSTGRDGIETCGASVDPRSIPYFSHIDIPGYHNWTLADDTGEYVQNHADCIEVRMKTHEEAVAWGVPRLLVRIWKR